MDFMNSNNTMEGTLAAAFGKAVVVAIADLMDDGTGQQSRKADPQKKQHTSAHSRSSSSSESINYSSPHNHFHWLSGDCVRETAANSLATITECATMKTDNTSPAMVSPCNSTESNHSGDADTNMMIAEEEEQNSNSNKNKNNNKNGTDHNIISRYRAEEHPPRREEPMDYTDPMNSILVEDYQHHPSDLRYSKNRILRRSRSGGSGKNNRSAYFNSNNSGGLLCGSNTTSVTEDEDWFATASSSSSWCGGVPAILMYSTSTADDNDGNDNGNAANQSKQQQQHQQQQHYPDYYADFKPQRQYAFDEEDGEESTLTYPTMEDNHGRGGGSSDGRDSTGRSSGNGHHPKAYSSDEASVTTGVSSTQSFMMINRPHAHASTITETPGHAYPRRHSEPNQHRWTSPRAPGPSSPHRITSPPSLFDSENENDDDLRLDDCALSRSLTRKLQKHLPFGKRGDSFWLQYSLIRDGASLDSLFGMLRRDKNNTGDHVHSVLAIETVEGEVFGAFLTQTWRRSNQRTWYGGGQSFLWTTARSKDGIHESNENENNENESSLRVFKYSFADTCVQLCDKDRLLIGGGDAMAAASYNHGRYDRHCYGFGLALENDLLRGTSHPCTTFNSPSLSNLHSDGSAFEIRNLEVWTLGPCLSMVQNPSQGLVRVHGRNRQQRCSGNL